MGRWVNELVGRWMNENWWVDGVDKRVGTWVGGSLLTVCFSVEDDARGGECVDGFAGDPGELVVECFDYVHGVACWGGWVGGCVRSREWSWSYI